MTEFLRRIKSLNLSYPIFSYLLLNSPFLPPATPHYYYTKEDKTRQERDMSHICYSLADLRRKGPNHYTYLYLDEKGLGDAEAVEVAQLLKGNTTITEVYLSGNQINDTGAAALGEAFKVNTTITTVYLNSNQISDRGAAALGEAFKVNTTITTVDLGVNQISDTGAAALGEAFKVNTTITKVYLSYNNITRLPAALAQNRTITDFDYYGNPIDYIPPSVER